MQLSILITTNRTGLLACSRIAQACSWASPEIEVIVRDNSGDAQKREFLALCRRDYCNIIIAEPCDVRRIFPKLSGWRKASLYSFSPTTISASITPSRRCLACSVSAARIPRGGVTGAYAVEVARDVDRQLSERGIGRRRGARERIFELFRPERLSLCADAAGNRPARLRFHEYDARLFFVSRPGHVLLYLLNGKFVRLKRLLYLYDVGVWEAGNSAQKRDVDFYQDAGMDPAINKLHWFCAALRVRCWCVTRFVSRLSARPAPSHCRSLVFNDVYALQRHARLLSSPVSRAKPTSCTRNC